MLTHPLEFENTYQSLVQTVITHGERRESRAGPTRALFGCTLTTFALHDGKFPILTARQMFYKPVLGELAAFLRGATDLKTFKKYGCNYWDANAEAWPPNKGRTPEEMQVGRIYGAQWRRWMSINGTVDQLGRLVYGLKNDPFSRRHLLTTFNPGELESGCLTPCHILAQFNVTNDKHLDCAVYMRSVDLCLGLPSDIILYAALMLLVGSEANLKPGILHFSLGDTHIYENHIEPFREMIQRPIHPLPTWELNIGATTWFFEPQNLTLNGYKHGEKLHFPFNV
jgi:thymidylate synthase